MIRLIADRVEMIFQERGGLKRAFQIMREGVRKAQRSDEGLVETMVKRLERVGDILSRHRKSALMRYSWKWRQAVYTQKNEMEVRLLDLTRSCAEDMVTSLVDLNPQLPDSWR